jgi:E1A/CREB-binding protein
MLIFAQEPAKKKARKSKKDKAREAAAAKRITPQDVTAQLMDLHEKQVMTHDKAVMLFNEPVDIVKYNIPDYPKIIKTPMDFGTIRTKLANHEYKDHLEYCDDVRLVFNNAWTFNKKATNVYKYTSEVAKYFDTRMWGWGMRP